MTYSLVPPPPPNSRRPAFHPAFKTAGADSSAAAAGSKDAADGDVTYSLVAFPAKDNYEGRLYPLEWIKKVCVV